MLRFADLEGDDDLLEVARRLAARLLTGDQAMVDRHLERWAGVRSAMAKA
jgi:ATP-dependent DNA helicase RecG